MDSLLLHHAFGGGDYPLGEFVKCITPTRFEICLILPDEMRKCGILAIVNDGMMDVLPIYFE